MYLGAAVSDWNYASTNIMVYHDKGTCICSVPLHPSRYCASTYCIFVHMHSTWRVHMRCNAAIWIWTRLSPKPGPHHASQALNVLLGHCIPPLQTAPHRLTAQLLPGPRLNKCSYTRLAFPARTFATPDSGRDSGRWEVEQPLTAGGSAARIRARIHFQGAYGRGVQCEV